MNEKVKYWVELAEYDLRTADAMHSTGRYLYVGFMCHQTIERILKALYSKNKQTNPPYKHNLSYLAKKADIYDEIDNDAKDFLDILEPLNIEARYPADKDRVFKSFTEQYSAYLIQKTKELYRCFKAKL